MAGKADSPKLYQQTPLVRISKIAETIFEDGVSTTIRKFHDKETQSFSKERKFFLKPFPDHLILPS